MDRLEQAKLVLKCATDEIERLEAELAEAEKPELRHGDYGTGDYKGTVIEWQCDGSAPDGMCLESFGLVSNHIQWFRPGQLVNLRVFGNAQDDLKAMAEVLTEFTVENGSFQTIKVKISDGFLRMRDRGGYMLIRACALPELILNLRRLQATQERNNAV